MLSGRDQRVGLDCTVALDELLPKWRQCRAAAMNATRLRRNHCIVKATVHVVDQQPGAPVRHAQHSARL